MSVIGTNFGDTLALGYKLSQLSQERNLGLIERLHDGKGLTYVRGGTFVLPPASFSGCDLKVGIVVQHSQQTQRVKLLPFGELQTLTISSHRGVSPVRFLGEHWVRDYVRGTRTFAGTLVFSVLNTGVFSSFLGHDRREVYTPYTAVEDQLPPFTILVSGVTEMGQMAGLVIQDVTLISKGMTMSVDDILTESTYNYVAKWVTPFLDGRVSETISNVLRMDSRPARPVSEVM